MWFERKRRMMVETTLIASSAPMMFEDLVRSWRRTGLMPVNCTLPTKLQRIETLRIDWGGWRSGGLLLEIFLLAVNVGIFLSEGGRVSGGW